MYRISNLLKSRQLKKQKSRFKPKKTASGPSSLCTRKQKHTVLLHYSFCSNGGARGQNLENTSVNVAKLCLFRTFREIRCFENQSITKNSNLSLLHYMVLGSLKLNIKEVISSLL